MMSSVLFLSLQIVADHYAVVYVLFSKRFTNSEWDVLLDTLPIIQVAVLFHVVAVILTMFYWCLGLWWFGLVWGLGFFLSLMTFFSFSHKDVSVCVNFFLKNYLVFPPLQVIKKLKSRLLKKPSSLVFFPVSLLYDCSLYSQDSTESNLIAIP